MIVTKTFDVNYNNEKFLITKCHKHVQCPVQNGRNEDCHGDGDTCTNAWKYKADKCSSVGPTTNTIARAYCVLFDKNYCLRNHPMLEDMLLIDESNFDPTFPINNDLSPTVNKKNRVICKFDVNRILGGNKNIDDRFKMIMEWKKMFGEKDETYIEAMKQLCSEPNDQDCQYDVNRAGRPPKCSWLHSDTSIGRYCRKWFNASELNSKTHDAIIDTICQGMDEKKLVDKPECLCYARNYNPVYDAVKMASPIDDECWWLPCQDKNRFLIQSSMKPSQCNATLCNDVINVIQRNNVDISGNKFNISCNDDPFPKKKTKSIKKEVSILLGFYVIGMISMLSF